MTAPVLVACTPHGHYPRTFIPYLNETTCKCGAVVWPGDARDFAALPAGGAK